MLTASVLCLALAVAPPPEKWSDEPAPPEGTSTEPKWSDEPTATDIKPRNPKPAPSGAMNFDALPPPPHPSDDARVKRFLGAFTGGVVGLGASLALMPLGDSLGCFGGSCVSFLHGLVGTFAPLLALGGAWLGFEIMGGDGGLLTPALALAPAFLLALALLSVARDMDAQSTLSMMPYVIASGVFLAGGAALALDLRARQVSALGGAAGWGKASPGRVAVTALITALTGTATGFLTALAVSLGSFSALGPILGILVAATGTVGVAAAAWGVHRAMNGRGSFLSALTGLGIGWAVALAGVGLYAASQGGISFNPVRSTAGIVMLVELGVAAAVFSPVLAMEWSHTSAVEASLPQFSFSAAPLPQGGMVGATMRF